MSKTLLLLVAGICWLIATVSRTEIISHAQEPGGTLRLPFQGRVTANDSPGAFSVINSGSYVAVRAEGGVAGVLALGTQYGLVAKGNDLGLYGEGLDFGVGGKSPGLAGVIGKVEREATENRMAEDGSTVVVKKGDPHSQTYGYLGSHTEGVTGVALAGAKAAVYGKWVTDASKTANAAFLTRGVTHGYLGTSVNGVQGESEAPNGFGVAGKAENGMNAAGVYGQSDKGFAGFFRGKVTVTERLFVKRVDAVEIYAKGGLVGQNAGKFFKIDHPQDPENQYLVHASVESDEYKNFYDGMATLDAKGTAVVTLPDWFEALNKDFRYQLTPVGAYAPLYIGKEIERGTFQISGGTAGLRVSWMVTGVRRDVYASAHPVEVEQPKAVKDRGKYLSPREHGKPETRGIDYQPDRVLSLGEGPRSRTP